MMLAALRWQAAKVSSLALSGGQGCSRCRDFGHRRQVRLLALCRRRSRGLFIGLWRRAEQLRDLCPNHARFSALRDELDPRRLFDNAFLRRVL